MSNSFATPCTVVARQAPLSMGFLGQEYWSGLPFPSAGDHPGPGIEPASPAFADEFFATEPPGKPSPTFKMEIESIKCESTWKASSDILQTVKKHMFTIQTLSGEVFPLASSRDSCQRESSWSPGQLLLPGVIDMPRLRIPGKPTVYP